MTRAGLLLVVSGPSGAGKGTICQALMDKYPSFQVSISVTTRAPRIGEIPNKSYYFMRTDEVKKMIEKDELLEWAYVYENYYGTPANAVYERLRNGEDLILEIEMLGALQVKKKFPDAVLIYILPPSRKILEERLVGRQTDSMDVIKKRLQCVAGELKYIKKYDYLLINKDLEHAQKQLECIIEAERCKPKRLEFAMQWKECEK